MKPRWILEAIGAALLLLLPFFSPLISPGNTLLLHHRLDLANPIYGLLIDMAVVIFVALSLLVLVSRIPPEPRKIATALLVVLVIWWISLFWLHLNFLIPTLVSTAALLKSRVTRRIAQAIRIGLAAFSFCALWVLPQLLHIALALRATPSFDHSQQVAQTGSNQRIIWILFDELSYNLVFDHPQHGEHFPNLQNLRSASISFANIRPVGFDTEEIIPSLLAGKEIDKTRENRNGDLLYFDLATHRWLTYDADSSLFGTAWTHGWNPGIAGWYNPACRIFASVLTACSWQPGIQALYPFARLGASGDKSALANSLLIPRYLFDLFTLQKDPNSLNEIDQNIRDYQAVMANARILIQNDRLHFIYLHLSVPHPPGIYNRNTHKLCACGNYLDNLVLADDTLAQLMQEINQAPDANRTTVIVSSDHSWRVPLWKGTRYWTPEEEAVSGDKFDKRPVFLVHFPGQTTSYNVAGPIPELIEHGILASLLKRQVTSPQGLLLAFHLSPLAAHTPTDKTPPSPATPAARALR